MPIINRVENKVEGEYIDPSDATFAMGGGLNILFASSAGACPRMVVTQTRWIPVQVPDFR